MPDTERCRACYRTGRVLLVLRIQFTVRFYNLRLQDSALRWRSSETAEKRLELKMRAQDESSR